MFSTITVHNRCSNTTYHESIETHRVEDRLAWYAGREQSDNWTIISVVSDA